MENIEEASAVEEQQQPLLVVTEDMRSYFYEMAKWASFLAIVGFVFAGFMIVGALTVGAAINSSPEIAAKLGPLKDLGSIGFTAICLVYAFAIFYPSILMFKYSAKARIGVLYGEQASLDEAIGKLKSLFKYWAVVVMVFIALCIFDLVFRGAAG